MARIPMPGSTSPYTPAHDTLPPVSAAASQLQSALDAVGPVTLVVAPSGFATLFLDAGGSVTLTLARPALVAA